MAELLTVEEVARRAKLGEKAVRNAIRRGELRASKLCGRWRIRAEDCEAWIDCGVYEPDPIDVWPHLPAPPSRGSLASLRRIENEAA